MSSIVILGATGMLGQGVLEALNGFDGNVIASTRTGALIPGHADVSVFKFDALSDDLEVLNDLVTAGDWIINCIGIIKPHIKDDDASQRRIAMLVNGLFPDKLANYAETHGLRVLQIATDCVYSGASGLYTEQDEFDALDVYGKTKSLGEVPSLAMMHLRVSIIGPESGRSTSLFEWVRNQPENAEIFGFTDHLWNGVTTFHFGKICRGLVEKDIFSAGTIHITPGSTVSKDVLVSAIADRAGRSDITIVPKASGKVVNRTLSTLHDDQVAKIWTAAGYSQAPTVEAMIQEMPL